jgi:hypothetical protein
MAQTPDRIKSEGHAMGYEEYKKKIMPLCQTLRLTSKAFIEPNIKLAYFQVRCVY